MDMQNEKISLNGSTAIPDDLVIEILSRLPAKSVVRFKCLSKQWCSITSAPDFWKSFAVHASARPYLLCVFNEAGPRERIFSSFPYHQDPLNPYTPVETYRIECLSWFVDNHRSTRGLYPQVLSTTYRILNSTNGLMFFEYGLYNIIWNPTLRQHVVLPRSKILSPVVSFLGYDPIDQKYKVLSMSGYTGRKRYAGTNPGNIKVLTLGAQESWRDIKIPRSLFQDIRVTRSFSWHGGISARGGICINGVLYYYLLQRDFIVSFDVRSETLAKIRKPEGVSDVDVRDVTCAMINYKGKLAWICTRTSSLWVLEDAHKQEWSLSPLDGQMNNSSQHYFRGVTNAHQVIYMPEKQEQPFCAFYYDLESKRTRKVAYQGIEHQTSEMFHYSYDCDYFPNHIDNLMTLKNFGFEW